MVKRSFDDSNNNDNDDNCCVHSVINLCSDDDSDNEGHDVRTNLIDAKCNHDAVTIRNPYRDTTPFTSTAKVAKTKLNNGSIITNKSEQCDPFELDQCHFHNTDVVISNDICNLLLSLLASSLSIIATIHGTQPGLNTLDSYFKRNSDAAATIATAKSKQNNKERICHKVQIYHIQQLDSWSCGFRNWQMLLSALLPHLSLNHPAIARFDCRVPTLQQLQKSMEESWAANFDPEGAKHYSYSIVGKKNCKIGAVEVLNTLTFEYIDATVVQFVKCLLSRSSLIPFVLAYFTKSHRQQHYCQDWNQSQVSTSNANTKHQTNLCDCLSTSSRVIAEKMLHEVEFSTTSTLPARTCGCDLFPLYLQWHGHSVTVVGVENRAGTSDHKNNSSSLSNNYVNDVDVSHLLILDPNKSAKAMRRDLMKGKLPECMRLPIYKLSKKDCQVLLTSSHALTSAERLKRQHQINVLTACKGAVDKCCPSL